MNVLFISSLEDIQSPEKPLQFQSQIQFGISYISSFLKKQGHQSKLLVLSGASKNKETVDECMENYFPQLVCFTAVSTEYRFIAKIAKYIKKRLPGIYLLVGGPHVSLNTEEFLPDDFDALCIGEGETPTLELVSQLEKGQPPSGIRNLWIRKDSGVEKNPARPFLQDLDRLPFPDRDMWQPWIEKEEKGKGAISILLGRGCPFRCTYCCNHALKKLAPGTYVRLRSPDNIIEELKELTEKFPDCHNVHLEIETIGVDKKWTLELCTELERFNTSLDRPFSFSTNLRVTSRTDLESLYSLFKKSNIHSINIGLESGSERIRKEILKRNYSNNTIVKAVSLARRFGLKVTFYNLLGIPGETIDDFKETIKMNRNCLPDNHMLSIFFPYPGTELHELCKKQALLQKPIDSRRERSMATLDLPGFSKQEIQKCYIWFDYYAFKGKKSLYKILSKVLVSKFKSNPFLNRFYRQLTRLTFIRELKDALKRY